MLEGLFEGTLSADRRTELEHHLDACERCSATVAELARLFGSATWGPGSNASNHDTPPSSGAAHEHGEPPAEFGRYRLGRRLGAGGMGMVFEAEDRELDRRVALKLLYSDPRGDVEQTRARLVREARAMARIAHPNVVAVYDVGRIGEQVFLAMELVEGCTLTKWLTGKRSRADILAAFVMAGRGLAAAHAAELVHRDFKPDNVLVGADGRVRVTDFGLALATQVASETEVSPATTDLRASTQILTKRGAIVGTPAYMAPEQWRGQPADARSDQFSFCVALYEALFGMRPFAGDTVHTLARAVLDDRPRSPPRKVSSWLLAALMHGLARDPAARFPNIGELLDVLERDRSKPRRVLAAVAATGLVSTAAVGMFAWVTSGSELEGRASVSAETPAPATAKTQPRDSCDAAAEHARGRWTNARREALEAHVGAMDHGEALTAALMPVLDAWVADWSTQAKRLCDPATGLDHREARSRCLDAALARFDAMVLRAGELYGFEVASALATAAYRLPELARCDHDGWLSLTPAPPPTELAGKAALVGKDLAALEAHIDLEQWVSARSEAAAVVATSEDLGYAPLLAEAKLAQGRLDALVGETDLAIVSLEAAAEIAELAGHERVLGLAALALVEQRGAQLRFEIAKRWLRVASALAERLDDAGLRGRTLLAEARMLAVMAEHRDALDKLGEAEAALREVFAEQHPIFVELELARADAALATADLHVAKRAAEGAERLAVASLGPAALDTARAKAARARVALASHDLREAEELATAASRIPGVGRSRRHDLDRGRTLGLLGDIALARGDLAAALERYEDAETYLYAAPESALPLLWQAAALLRRGEIEAGLALADAGGARLDEVWTKDDLRRLDLLRFVGLAALEAGELDRARTDLERAVALIDEAIGFGPRLARAKADLGMLERAAGHPREALTLLDRSYVGMVAGIGQRHPELVEVTLTRADLAWELDQRDYAARLYGNLHARLLALRGPDDPATLRAAARVADE